MIFPGTPRCLYSKPISSLVVSYNNFLNLTVFSLQMWQFNDLTQYPKISYVRFLTD